MAGCARACRARGGCNGRLIQRVVQFINDARYRLWRCANVGDGQHGTVTGDLTLHGVTKPVTLDVTFNGVGSGHRSGDYKNDAKISDLDSGATNPNTGDPNAALLAAGPISWTSSGHAWDGTHEKRAEQAEATS